MTELDGVGRPPTPGTAECGEPRRTLVLGGARSGKSRVAEDLLADAAAVDYVATASAVPDDPDWAARIDRHRRRRPRRWRTLETGEVASLVTTPGPPLLVDSLTAWLTRLLDEHDAWREGSAWRPALDAATGALIAAVTAPARTVVMVSDEVGSGVVPATRAGRLFRDELGELNARVAGVCDRVLLVTVGIPQRLR